MGGTREGQGIPDVPTLSGGGLREPIPQARVARVDAQRAAGLGIREPDLAHVDEHLLARVADLDGEHIVSARHVEERPFPVTRAAEVGDDDHQGALARDRGDGSERGGKLGCGSRPVAGYRRARAARQPGPLAPAAGATGPTGRRRTRAARSGCHARSPHAHGESDAEGDIRFASIRSAEVHRERAVEHDPGYEHTLREVDANMGPAPCEL